MNNTIYCKIVCFNSERWDGFVLCWSVDVSQPDFLNFFLIDFLFFNYRIKKSIDY